MNWGLSTIHRKDGSVIELINLVSRTGLHWVLDNTVYNYTGFALLGTVMVALLGIGAAEKKD